MESSSGSSARSRLSLFNREHAPRGEMTDATRYRFGDVPKKRRPDVHPLCGVASNVPSKALSEAAKRSPSEVRARFH
jgi:hypothetical protein